MALTSIIGKTIFRHVWGKFRVYAYEALSAGALIGADATNDGFIEADQGDSVGAMAIAMEDIAASTFGWACLAAEVAIDSRSAATCAASTDVGSALYLGEEGDVSTSAGATYAQQVGYVTSTSTFLLLPATSLSGTALSLSGNLSVGGTLGVTGAATLGADSTFSTNKKIQFRDTGIYINSGADGKLTISADGAGADDITLSGTVTASDNITVASAKQIIGAGTGANGIVLKNLKNAATSDLSGTALDVEIDIGGTPYYFHVYPNKA